MSVIIRLQNLPISANASNIRRFFGGLTIPEGGVHIVGGNEGDAFIAFATDEDARKAMLLDRQSINGAAVRLFLSSKTEMQSIIESAKSSALFSGAGVSTPQLSIQKTETMNALDLTAPTLPNSFPSYRNGAMRDSFIHDSANQLSYQYNKDVPVSLDNSGRPPISALGTKTNDDFSNESRIAERSSQSKLNTRDFVYNNMSAPPPQRYDGRSASVTQEFNLPRERGALDRSQLYGPYYDEYEHNRRPLSFPDDHFPVRSKDMSGRNITRDLYQDRYPLGQDDGSLEFNKYPHPQSPRTYSDRFTHSATSRDVNRQNPSALGNEGRDCGVRINDRDAAFDYSRHMKERDFSIRPPWLNENMPIPCPKRPFQPSVPEFEEYPRKRRPLPQPSQSNDLIAGETEFVIRVCLPISEVGVKCIFEVLRGVHIVPKWGIRIEEDKLQRYTGYVFIMLTARDSFDRALCYDGRHYKGETIRVLPSSLDEFYSVTDSNFRNKCPPEIMKKLPPPDQISTPHHSDGCLELAELPPDATKNEVVCFLGAPGLVNDNVTIARFAPNDKAAPYNNAIRALVCLPSAGDLKILLSAKPRPFRSDNTTAVRLTPISKLQLAAYSKLPSLRKPEQSLPKVTEPVTSKPSSTYVSESEGLLTCAYFSGFSRVLKDSEVLRLFSVLIPGDAIRMGPDHTSAYIDFISENNCRRAIAEVSGDDSAAKKAHPSLHIEAISRSEMDNRLRLSNKADDQSNLDRLNKVRDRDPRDNRGPWDPRPRPVHHQLNQFPNRPPSVRSKLEDNYYDRPGGPQSYEDLHNDQFIGPNRRIRPPVDTLNTVPPHEALLSNRPHLPGPSRHGGLTYVTVFVGNLPPTCTVDQLAGIMRDYFFIPGSIRLRRDPQGQTVGEALVDFKSSYEADRALRALNGYRLGGRPLVLRFDHRI